MTVPDGKGSAGGSFGSFTSQHNEKTSVPNENSMVERTSFLAVCPKIISQVGSPLLSLLSLFLIMCMVQTVFLADIFSSQSSKPQRLMSSWMVISLQGGSVRR